MYTNHGLKANFRIIWDTQYTTQHKEICKLQKVTNHLSLSQAKHAVAQSILFVIVKYISYLILISNSATMTRDIYKCAKYILSEVSPDTNKVIFFVIFGNTVVQPSL